MHKKIGVSLFLGIMGLLLVGFSDKAGAYYEKERVGSTPTVLTERLPNGWTDHQYIATIRSRDVDLGNKLTMISSNLPEGLSLNNCQQFVLGNSERLHCDLTGVVEESGTYKFKIGVVDNNGNTGTQIYTIDLTPAP